MERIYQTHEDDYSAIQRLLFAISLSLLVHAMIGWLAPVGGSAPSNSRAGIVAPHVSVLSASLQTGTAVFEADSKAVQQRHAVINGDSPDLRFYPVHELDILPLPRGPIQVGQSTALSGTVRVLTRIDASGRVTGTYIFDSDASAAQDAAALQALRHTNFSAARKDGRVVRSEVIVEMTPTSPQ